MDAELSGGFDSVVLQFDSKLTQHDVGCGHNKEWYKGGEWEVNGKIY